MAPPQDVDTRTRGGATVTWTEGNTVVEHEGRYELGGENHNKLVFSDAEVAE